MPDRARAAPAPSGFAPSTREVKPVDELIRFVVGPDGVVPDLKRKLPGRGLWVTADQGDAQRARSRAMSSRAASSATSSVDARSGRSRPSACWSAPRSMRSPSRAKSGLVAAGFAKVEAALMPDKPVAGLLHAATAGRRRRSQARGGAPARGRTPSGSSIVD